MRPSLHLGLGHCAQATNDLFNAVSLSTPCIATRNTSHNPPNTRMASLTAAQSRVSCADIDTLRTSAFNNYKLSSTDISLEEQRNLLYLIPLVNAVHISAVPYVEV